MNLAWGLLGVAVLVMPGSLARSERAQTSGPPPRAFIVRALAAGSVALACVLSAGPRVGLPVAAALGAATALAVRRVQHRPEPAEPDAALPLMLDLAAAALRSGRPLADAVALAAPAGAPETCAALLRVAALARLGADAEQAWAGVPRDGPLGALARVAVRSAASGLRLAAGFERLAGELRAERAAAAAVRAHRAAVSAMAPLAACFLPSFVCLGVVPVVVGVARSAFAVAL